jgi:hypothetical protein
MLTTLGVIVCSIVHSQLSRRAAVHDRSNAKFSTALGATGRTAKEGPVATKVYCGRRTRHSDAIGGLHFRMGQDGKMLFEIQGTCNGAVDGPAALADEERRFYAESVGCSSLSVAVDIFGPAVTVT